MVIQGIPPAVVVLKFSHQGDEVCDPSCHFILHVLFQLILHSRGVMSPCNPYRVPKALPNVSPMVLGSLYNCEIG